MELNLSLVLIALVCIIILLSILIYISKNMLKITKYTYENIKIPKKLDGKTIVQISDVHSRIYGKNNEEVINKVKEINPDIVIMSGDIIHKHEEKIDWFISMYEEIYKNYPTYYAIGNHEIDLGEEKSNYYIKKLKELGVHVLIDESEIYEESVIHGVRFEEAAKHRKPTEVENKDYFEKIKKVFENIDSNKFNILIAHDPENFEMYKKLNFDLIFSGHIHGGLIRVGKVCLLSPRRTFFPKYSYGMTKKGPNTIITSSGMGPASIDIRLFNRPEIVVVKLVSSR